MFGVVQNLRGLRRRILDVMIDTLLWNLESIALALGNGPWHICTWRDCLFSSLGSIFYRTSNVAMPRTQFHCELNQ